jgi:hypothetical protein
MSVAFNKGQQLSREDLNIYLRNAVGLPANAAVITYAIFDFTTGVEVLLGDPNRIPVNPGVGEYYAAFQIAFDANIGSYRIRWSFKETYASQPVQCVQEFNVIEGGLSATTQSYGVFVDELIGRLRILLRDNNPDRNYHFRPPTGEEVVNQYNKVFGYIWENYELREYLEDSGNLAMMYPPRTAFPDLSSLLNFRPDWKTLILTGGMMLALQALMINWISEEFGYSIGGVSLDLEKSSKYEAAKQNAESQWDKYIEVAKKTVKYTKGLQQSKYGTGIRSAFGPYVGRGVISPRKFIGV